MYVCTYVWRQACQAAATYYCMACSACFLVQGPNSIRRRKRGVEFEQSRPHLCTCAKPVFFCSLLIIREKTSYVERTPFHLVPWVLPSSSSSDRPERKLIWKCLSSPLLPSSFPLWKTTSSSSPLLCPSIGRTSQPCCHHLKKANKS